MRLMQEMDLTIEEVDALTGQAVGWPKSATFRTIDLVGLDILGHVVGNMTANVRDERSDLRLPDFFTQMLERKWLGDKTKGGFYKKSVRAARGQGRRAAGDRLEDAGISSAAEAEVSGARHGEECRGHGPARAHVAGHGWQPARRRATKRERFCGRRCPICGPTRRIACRRFRTRLSRSIAPCGWDSTGNWGRLNCGMRRALKRPLRA